MKAFMIILSLVFVSCVTATPRDLSAVNPKTEPLKSEPVSITPRKLVDYDACMTSCEEDGHSTSDCSDACSDNCFAGRCSSGVENKKPLMLADDYEDCMVICRREGGWSRGCHDECN